MIVRSISFDYPSGSASGSVSPGFETVFEQFERNLSDRGDHGAAFAVYLDGRLLIDFWGGLADLQHRRPWCHDTLAGIFSGTKGLVASCLLLLIERQAIDLDTPVCAYWPEFAAHGKKDILVRHIVSHQAGLPGLITPVSFRDATDYVRMAALLADQPPIALPGARLYYHALTFGWLCGELIRRVDGRSVGRFFDQEIARPLGLDAWIGLPAEHENRVALLEPSSGFGTQKRDRAAAPDHDPIAWSIWGNPERFGTEHLPANRRRWRAAEVPASNGVASARSLARLYGCLARGGEIDGVRVLNADTVTMGSTRLAHAVEPYLGEPIAFGVGFELQTETLPFGPVTIAYGHRGSGGSVHGVWPEHKLGFSYITNTLRETEGPDPRAAALLASLHEALVTITAKKRVADSRRPRAQDIRL
jgi:CubicO group peptidase (beta-lactamase class C family)